jgi:hypothetical protein
MMVTIGIDPHKQAHTGVAVDPLGVQVSQRTVAARREGFGLIRSMRWRSHAPRCGRASRRSRPRGSPALSSRSGCWRCIANAWSANGPG